MTLDQLIEAVEREDLELLRSESIIRTDQNQPEQDGSETTTNSSDQQRHPTVQEPDGNAC